MNRSSLTSFLRRRPLAVAAGAVLVATIGVVSSASAGTLAGSITLVKGANPGAGTVLASGGSALQFALQLPSGAACTGDTSTGGYRVQTFIVSSNVTVSSLTFDSGGPTPTSTGATVRLPLFNQGTPFIDGNTAVGSGAVTGLPSFDFSVFGSGGPSVLPNGTYTLGVACTKGVAGPTQVDKYWTTQITVTATPSDTPSGLTWVVGSGAPPTTTTTTIAATTTTAAAATTSIAGSTTTVATSTSVAGGSTTSVAATTTTSGSATSTTADLSTTTITDSSSGGLVATGTSPMPMVLWGLLLLLLGRVVVLVARPVRVRPPEGR
ncbi:MAG: hypothetical protein KGR47_09155 [Acidobacteria bacterium]|nr:hypothetical protein [Acidobacteriota bacterium]